ncbi:restriction endonuclease subunit S [Microbacterium sp. USHLN272]|uniref:restriction endonuclease subunit S n=1 Tax=Microbacterium sp. USHLN272 TaxID=3081287 RepID=UPI003017E552
MSETTLGALANAGVLSLGDGYRTRQSELTDSGYRIIRVADVRDGRVAMDSPDFVDAAFERQIGVKAARAGDVLLTTKGTVGRVAVVPELATRAVYSPQLCWFRVLDFGQLNSRFLSYWLQAPSFLAQASYLQGNTDMAPYISLSDLRGSKITLPPLSEQRAIAEVLGALDDKIAANTALAATAARLAQIELGAATTDGAHDLSVQEVATLITRGITPRYVSEGDGTRVINQKCVRDQIVSLDPSRWTDDAKVKADRLLVYGDVLVNSTGQGTLGRVARWTLPGAVTADSHITIVRPDPSVSDPDVIGHAILAIEADIEALGEGSTGQTELSRIELGRARVLIPGAGFAVELGAKLRGLSARQDAARAENRTLAATRDALLPQLMSGRLRVRDAEAVASAAGA